MLARIRSCGLAGVEAYLVDVEVELAGGLPTFEIVGLPDPAVRESRERVRAALRQAGFRYPVRRITVNLAPGTVRKAGPAFDLPIALGILAALGEVPAAAAARPVVAGELSLAGAVRPVRGALCMALASRAAGRGELLLPRANAPEASLVPGITLVAVASLGEAVAYLRGRRVPAVAFPPAVVGTEGTGPAVPLLEDVAGQVLAKRVLEIAAAGGHNLLLIGPPGAGKTMLARRLAGLLPPPDPDEWIEIARIHSAAGLLGNGGLGTGQRPFRNPHPRCTLAGLLGTARGGVGEATLAHGGVLFLDELAEFRGEVLEALRQPLEEGYVSVPHAPLPLRYPARFLLAAAANPCPCGFLGDPQHPCHCPPGRLARYASRLSGPLLDRIDLVVRVERPRPEELWAPRAGETTAAVRERVARARRQQRARVPGGSGALNGHLRGLRPGDLCRPGSPAARLARQAAAGLGLSPRAMAAVLRVARTVADLEGSEEIEEGHVAEALQYRPAPSLGAAPEG